MLVVEGPDCVGKTTLCKKLVTLLGDHIYAHFTRLPDAFDRYWGYLERMSLRVVQDRFHMSEVLYAPARGDTSPLDPETYRLVDAQLRLVGGFTLLITADDELINERFDDSQMFSRDDTVKTARLYYGVACGVGTFGDYQMDIDYHFHCTRGTPHVPDKTIGRVAELYRHRLIRHVEIGARRPFTVQVGGILATGG